MLTEHVLRWGAPSHFSLRLQVIIRPKHLAHLGEDAHLLVFVSHPRRHGGVSVEILLKRPALDRLVSIRGERSWQNADVSECTLGRLV